jgi:hypothetical protein
MTQSKFLYTLCILRVQYCSRGLVHLNPDKDEQPLPNSQNTQLH